MDKLHAYQVFVAVVEAGSFSAAARNLGLAQPTVSKQVAALEAELGIALLTRTTRRLHVTAAGEQFYESARAILDSVAQTEAAARRLDQDPIGTLRLNIPSVFGQQFIVPMLPDFLHRYANVKLDLRFTDQFVDMLEEGVDLVIRIGRHSDTTLVARKLGVTRRAVVGAPSYFARRGIPQHPQDLVQHECLAYAGGRSGPRWRFLRRSRRDDHGGRDNRAEQLTVDVDARVTGDNGRVLRQLAVQGLGIAVLATWLIGPDISAGRLQQVLVDFPIPLLDIVAIYPSRRFLPHRTRCFIDMLQAHLAEQPELAPEQG